MYRGKLITFEGGEGSGKTSLTKMYYEHLKNEGKNVVLCHDPGSTKICKKIRSILLDSKNTDITKKTELFLYIAARTQMIDEIIKPNIDKGYNVICDRYIHSTRVYQYIKGNDMDLILDLEKISIGEYKPDFTFICDVDPKIGLKRSINRLKIIEKDESRFENESLEFHNKVRRNYLKEVKKNNNLCILYSDTHTLKQMLEDVIDFNLI